MIRFVVDARDVTIQGRSCNSCCCQQASARPGEINKWDINYMPWVMPLGGRGLISKTEFAIEKRTVSADPNAPINTNYYFPGDFNTTLTGSLATSAVDPNGEDLTYEELMLFGAEFGAVTLNKITGAFTYEPVLGFTGYDSFFFATKNEGKQVVRQVIVGINAAASGADLPPKDFKKDLTISSRSMRIVNQDELSFALAASPALNVGDVYQLTVKQPALDCDCNEYTHVSCYDITIVNC